MTPVLLDTHVFVRWLFRPSELSKNALRRLESPEGLFYMSAVSVLEIQLLREIGRVHVTMPQVLDYFRRNDRFRLLPVDEVVLSSSLEVPTRDPFDRLIMATALAYDVPVVTKDAWMTERFPKKTLW